MSNLQNTTVVDSTIGTVVPTFEFLPLVDWLQFTIPVDSADALHGEAWLWCDILGGGSVLPAARFGYTHGYSVCGSGMVMWNPGRVEMGVHVVLPSSALALLPEVGDENPRAHVSGVLDTLPGLEPVELIRMVVEAGGRFTRVDVNQDSSAVDLDTVAAALASPLLVSKARSMRHIVGFGRSGDDAEWEGAGTTLYVGSRQSQRIVRFYDKALEQGVMGRTWVRCEAEFRSDAAHAAALHLAGGRSVGDLIVSVVDFRNEDDSNTTRRSRCDWWSAWVGVAARVSFARKKVQRTVEDALAWVEKAVSPTLAMLSLAGADLKHLLHTVTEKGFSRLDVARRQRAYAYRDSGYTLVPAIPESLAGVFDDVSEWVINRAFMCMEGV